MQSVGLGCTLESPLDVYRRLIDSSSAARAFLGVIYVPFARPPLSHPNPPAPSLVGLKWCAWPRSPLPNQTFKGLGRPRRFRASDPEDVAKKKST